MVHKNLFLTVIIAVILVVQPATARWGGSQMAGPGFKGIWKPKVGSGAVYQVEQKGQPPMSWEIVAVGQEAGGDDQQDARNFGGRQANDC